MYLLSDLEEDEDPWMERKMGEDDEDEGIMFKVRSSSTPQTRKDRCERIPHEAPPYLSAVSSAAMVTSTAGTTTVTVSKPGLTVNTTAPPVGEFIILTSKCSEF